MLRREREMVSEVDELRGGGETEVILNSLRQKMCPHVRTRRVTPSSSMGCAGESMARAVSSSASIARSGVRQTGQVLSAHEMSMKCETPVHVPSTDAHRIVRGTLGRFL